MFSLDNTDKKRAVQHTILLVLKSVVKSVVKHLVLLRYVPVDEVLVATTDCYLTANRNLVVGLVAHGRALLVLVVEAYGDARTRHARLALLINKFLQSKQRVRRREQEEERWWAMEENFMLF